MSQYIKFVLEYYGVPIPTKVLLLQHERDWANRQIVDEFRFLFPDIGISTIPEVGSGSFDLLVLPYMENLSDETPGGLDLYRQLRRVPAGWVMLYGLCHRQLECVPARQLERYYRARRRINRLIALAQRIHMVKAITFMISRHILSV